MDKLLDTIRLEMGTCIERAYQKISLEGATRMLHSDHSKMQAYASQVSFLFFLYGWKKYGNGYSYMYQYVADDLNISIIYLWNKLPAAIIHW